jgi:hypothetical protein
MTRNLDTQLKGQAMVGTIEFIKAMEQSDLTPQEAWRAALREVSHPRFDKRTGTTVSRGVFVGARRTLGLNRPDLFKAVFGEDYSGF